MMPKSDTIAAIQQLNPTADPTFLAEFSVSDLQAYLQRLNVLRVDEKRAPVMIPARRSLDSGAVVRAGVKPAVPCEAG